MTLTGAPAGDPVIVVFTPVDGVWSTTVGAVELIVVAAKVAVAVAVATRAPEEVSKPLAVAVLVVEVVKRVVMV